MEKREETSTYERFGSSRPLFSSSRTKFERFQFSVRDSVAFEASRNSFAPRLLFNLHRKPSSTFTGNLNSQRRSPARASNLPTRRNSGFYLHKHHDDRTKKYCLFPFNAERTSNTTRNCNCPLSSTRGRGSSSRLERLGGTCQGGIDSQPRPFHASGRAR